MPDRGFSVRGGFGGYEAVSRRGDKDGKALALKYGRSYIHARSPPVKRGLGQSFQGSFVNTAAPGQSRVSSAGINLPYQLRKCIAKGRRTLILALNRADKQPRCFQRKFLAAKAEATLRFSPIRPSDAAAQAALGLPVSGCSRRQSNVKMPLL